MAKQRKRQLLIRVSAKMDKEVRRIADDELMSISCACEELIEMGLERRRVAVAAEGTDHGKA